MARQGLRVLTCRAVIKLIRSTQIAYRTRPCFAILVVIGRFYSKIMSGGHFDYNQYRINDIADSIERELNRQGKEKPKDELYGDKEYYYTYPEIVQEKMKEAVKQLKIAAIYAQRVDWFLSGDDGEESFIERLAEDLNAL